MAKYTILMSCGHEDTIDLTGKTSDRDKKIAYFKAYGLCRECYKHKMEADNKLKGLIFNASVLPYIDENDGEILLFVWFSGDTITYKDAIKSLGYRWGAKEAGNDWLMAKRTMCWHKTIGLNQLAKEIKKATAIGAKRVISDKELFTMLNYQIATEKQRQWKEKHKQIELIEKPIVPQILAGHKWNQKIYGKAGNYTVYPDGAKVAISDEQAEEIKLYIAKKEEYQKKVEKIKNA